MSEFTRPSRYFDYNHNETNETDDKPFQRFGSNNSPQQKFKKHEKGKKKQPKTPEEKRKSAVKKKELTKKRQEKKRRIIIRNLSFKVEVDELNDVLSKFGTVTDVVIPKGPDGKKRGFAFAQFENFQSCAKAIKDLNFKKLNGRPVAIDYAIPKSEYEHTVSSRKTSDANKTEESDSDESDSEHGDIKTESDVKLEEEDEQKEEDKSCEMNEDEKRVIQVMNELGFKSDSENEDEDKDGEAEEGHDSEDSSCFDGDNDDDDVSDIEEDVKTPKKRKSDEMTNDGNMKDEAKASKKPKPADDTQEGKTVFVRNISFETTDECFKEAMSEFGPFKYCLLCINPITELPRGTAFVKFENKEDAEKLIEKTSDPDAPGLFLDGRRLYGSVALSRDEIQKKSDGNVKVKKDKRNLYLLREGVILPDSEEAKGMSASDLATRTKLDAAKKIKLKNFNFFVSQTRLCIHNLPANYTNVQLRKLFKDAVGTKVVITEARVMKDLNKVDGNGEARSKGFGFVAFNRHEDALAALQKLNNNPTAFTGQKRPIVEFSIENHQALLSKQRRRENMIKNQKRKSEIDEKSDKQEAGRGTKMANGKQWGPRKSQGDKASGFNSRTQTPKQKGNNNRAQFMGKGKPGFKQAQSQRSPTKGKQNLKKKHKGNSQQPGGDRSFKNKVDGYKNKLLQKL